jgi:phenylacetic acid degradation operon negative regulatory protein
MVPSVMSSWLHHPDVSLPVVKRRVAEEFLEMLMLAGDLIVTRGWAITRSRGFPSTAAYHQAVYRLRRKGLVAWRKGAKGAGLLVTEQGRDGLAAIYQPWKEWRREWGRRWYLLVYDVPESDRHYRNELRRFLKRLRMGYLQHSVWISPDDIRPDYDDLCKAASVSDYAVLFEARTVLGMPASTIVQSAWDFDVLAKRHRWYQKEAAQAMKRIEAGSCTLAQIVQIQRMDLAAYRAVMEEDPLLPQSLWPEGYLGPDIYESHRTLQRQIIQKLRRQS